MWHVACTADHNFFAPNHDEPRLLIMSTSEDSLSMKEVAQQALQANKDHQYALKVYTERLEAELKIIDKLLVCVSRLSVNPRFSHRIS